MGLRWRGLDDRLAHLWTGLHWALVVNIDGLAAVASAIRETFLKLPKDFGRNRELIAPGPGGGRCYEGRENGHDWW